MRLKIDNIITTAIVGGSDNLLDFDIMKELQKYLRVRPDGYERTTAYMDGRWDGYKYFITKGGKFATGFLPLVANFLTSLGVQILIEDVRGELPVLSDTLDDFIGEIDGTVWRANEETGRAYQLEQVAALKNYINVGGQEIYFPRGILDCATNAGKNSMAALVANNLKTKYETIFMVSNRTIYKQAVDFFSQVIGEPVGEVRTGKIDFKRFTVCMVKTLYNRAVKDSTIRTKLHRIKVLIVDESDESGATDYSKTLAFIGAGMRLFVSGTPLEASKVNNMISIGLSGPVLSKITNKDLIDAGHSQKPIIKILLNRTKLGYRMNYNDEKVKGIHTSLERVKLIEQILIEHSDKNVVVSFNDKIHGYFMYNYLKNALPNINMGIVHGDSKDRTEQIDDFKSGRITVLFASMILKRGANIPNIEVLIMGQGGKSVITVKQYLGRALRHDGKSDTVLVFDFMDVGQYIGKHSRDRVRIYKKEGFEVEQMYEHRRGFPVLK